jgi:DNA ligase-1
MSHYFCDDLQRPMLAATVDDITTQVKYPCYVQDKEDGIRCFMLHDEALTRTFKKIPNMFIRNKLKETMLPDGLDGEIITLDENGERDKYNDVQSKVMSKGGTPRFIYVVFDLASQYPFAVRDGALNNYLSMHLVRTWLQKVNQYIVTTQEGLELCETDAIARGKEGMIIRSPHGYYKAGRSTINEQYLLKLKRFVDDEAEIMGFEEFMHNCNEATTNAQGLTERSSHKDNLEPGNKLGALVCKCKGFQEYFKIGSGFTDAQRIDMWEHKLDLLGQKVTFKYFKHGQKDKPRHPIFKGMRYD